MFGHSFNLLTPAHTHASLSGTISNAAVSSMLTNSTIAQTSDTNQLTAATCATLPFSGLRDVDCAAVAAVEDDSGSAANVARQAIHKCRHNIHTELQALHYEALGCVIALQLLNM